MSARSGGMRVDFDASPKVSVRVPQYSNRHEASPHRLPPVGRASHSETCRRRLVPQTVEPPEPPRVASPAAGRFLFSGKCSAGVRTAAPALSAGPRGAQVAGHRRTVGYRRGARYTVRGAGCARGPRVQARCRVQADLRRMSLRWADRLCRGVGFRPASTPPRMYPGVHAGRAACSPRAIACSTVSTTYSGSKNT